MFHLLLIVLKVFFLLLLFGAYSIHFFDSLEPIIDNNGLGPFSILLILVLLIKVNLSFADHHCSESFFAVVLIIRLDRERKVIRIMNHR
jgi:hypothetical protein